MKQTKLWLTTIATLLCSLTASAHDFEAGGIYYNITSSTDLTVAVTYRGNYYNSYSNEYSGAVTIPSTVTYNNNTYSVASIGKSAFRDCRITSITIPEGVTEIGEFAFCDSWITSITIPEGVTTIGHGAFYESGLVSITIPSSVTLIEGAAFDYCSNLSAVHISDINGWCQISFGKDAHPLSYSKCHLYLNGELLTNLIIPEGVSSIENSAFWNCNSLTSITIPKSLTSIGDFAFASCDSLTTITIPDNSQLTSIGDCAFMNSNLTAITLPEGVTSIGNSAFSGCNSLTATAITIPESVTSIGGGAFEGCSSLTAITIPDNSQLTSIGGYAFKGCSNLTSISIPNSVTSIGDSAFEGCHNLYSVTIGSGVVSIGFKAFSSPDKVIWLTNTPPTGYKEVNGRINYVANHLYTDLKSVKIYPYLSSMFEVDGVKYVPISPSERICHAIDCAYDDAAATINVSETASFKGVSMKVTEVMPYTFYDNDHIKEVSVTHLGNIGDYAFYNCDAIETVKVSNQGDIGKQAFYSCDAIETVTACNQGDICSKAFYDCNGIKNVDIRNQGSIGSQAFYGCNGMGTAIVANKGTVGSEAFFGCSSLKTVTLGNSIGSLGDEAFYQCSNLQEIVIPNSVMSVGSSCFYGCTSMRNVMLGDRLTNIKEYTFANCGLEEIVIGDNITSIGDYAFNGCTRMKSAVLGNGLTWVNGTMFSGCTGLEKVEIGNNVRELAANAFSGCSSLSTITIPRAVTTIGDKAFAGCSRLSDVIISDRTTALALGSNGSSALFADCPLDSVYIGGKITYNTTSDKGYSPFYRNTSLRTVVITDREEQIYENEFYGCTNLQNVAIGNGVKSIGDYAFSGCSSLAGFSFGSNMESIGDEAFSDCTNLTSITSHAAVPPTCGTQALDDINKWSCTLRVPSGYDSAYQGADQWKEFFFVDDVVEVAKYTLTFMVDGEVYHTSSLVHKAEVTIPDAPTKEGYTFSGWNKVPATMPAEDVVFNGFFTINKYLVTFKIGDEVISSESLEYGANIVAPEAPEKKGHTFNGWGKVAKTVPAGDLTYEGSYSVNSYLLTYMVDGEIVQSDSIAYGTKLVTPKAPTKEGHTFSGWGKVPATMPAEDTTISGFFTPNTYKVYYYADGKLVHTAKVTYGEAIPEYVYEPTIEGEAFVGWEGEAYETMPAHNLTYKAEIEIRFITLAIDQYGSGTFCSAHALDFSEVEGLKAYVATGYNTATGEVTLTHVMTAKLGEGLFLKGKPGDYEVPTLKNPESCMQNLLVGTLEDTFVKSTSDDGLSINYRYAVKGGYTTPLFYRIYGTTIEAGKAYLQLPKAWLGTGATRATISLHFDDEEMEFGDEEQPADVAAPAVIYDLQGRRVANPTKGVFIVNGKKVVFK